MVGASDQHERHGMVMGEASYLARGPGLAILNDPSEPVAKCHNLWGDCEMMPSN